MFSSDWPHSCGPVVRSQTSPTGGYNHSVAQFLLMLLNPFGALHCLLRAKEVYIIILVLCLCVQSSVHVAHKHSC